MRNIHGNSKLKKRSPSLCQEELHGKMLLSEDKRAERSHLSWKEIDHISTIKCLGHSDLEVCFSFISHQGSLQSQHHNFKHLILFLYLDILSLKKWSNSRIPHWRSSEVCLMPAQQIKPSEGRWCKGGLLLTSIVHGVRISLATEKKSLHFPTVVTRTCDVEWSCWLSQQLKLSCYWGCFPTHFHNGKMNTNTQCLTSSRGSICKQSLAHQAGSLFDYTNA